MLVPSITSTPGVAGISHLGLFVRHVPLVSPMHLTVEFDATVFLPLTSAVFRTKT